MSSHTQTHTNTHTRMPTHTHAHTHARTHAHMHACTHAQRHTHTHAHKHAHTHAHRHAHTHTHTHTHAHTLMYIYTPYYFYAQVFKIRTVNSYTSVAMSASKMFGHHLWFNIETQFDIFVFWDKQADLWWGLFSHWCGSSLSDGETEWLAGCMVACRNLWYSSFESHN